METSTDEYDFLYDETLDRLVAVPRNPPASVPSTSVVVDLVTPESDTESDRPSEAKRARIQNSPVPLAPPTGLEEDSEPEEIIELLDLNAVTVETTAPEPSADVSAPSVPSTSTAGLLGQVDPAPGVPQRWEFPTLVLSAVPEVSPKKSPASSNFVPITDTPHRPSDEVHDVRIKLDFSQC